jgi:hypothetical protein
LFGDAIDDLKREVRNQRREREREYLGKEGAAALVLRL